MQAGARSGTANSLNRSHISVIRSGRNVFSQSRKLLKPIRLPFDCSSVVWVSVPDFSVAAGDIAESRPGELRHYAKLVAQLSLAASKFARYLGQTAALDAATCKSERLDAGQPRGADVVSCTQDCVERLRAGSDFEDDFALLYDLVAGHPTGLLRSNAPQSSGAERGHCQESGQCAIRTEIFAAASRIFSTFASLSPRTCVSFFLHSMLTLPTV